MGWRPDAARGVGTPGGRWTRYRVGVVHPGPRHLLPATHHLTLYGRRQRRPRCSYEEGRRRIPRGSALKRKHPLELFPLSKHRAQLPEKAPGQVLKVMDDRVSWKYFPHTFFQDSYANRFDASLRELSDSLAGMIQGHLLIPSPDYWFAVCQAEDDLALLRSPRKPSASKEKRFAERRQTLGFQAAQPWCCFAPRFAKLLVNGVVEPLHRFRKLLPESTEA